MYILIFVFVFIVGGCGGDGGGGGGGGVSFAYLVGYSIDLVDFSLEHGADVNFYHKKQKVLLFLFSFIFISTNIF